MILKPLHFISESIEVFYATPPVYEKTPHCPDAFSWRGQRFDVAEQINEWRDFQRRGRSARNMRPEHSSTAARRGSWGVGQFYFRIRTVNNRFFDLYFDRAPKDVDHRKGGWFLFCELIQVAEGDIST
jgi:hypothetical protein